MPAKTMEQLAEFTPWVEVDDFHAGFLMAMQTTACFPELKARYLAEWAARLRIHYVEIGQRLERDRILKGGDPLDGTY